MLDSSVSNSLSPEAMEKTFLMVKVSRDPGSLADPISQPDGVQRGLVGEILRRLEKKGLQLQACKLLQVRPAVGQEEGATGLSNAEDEKVCDEDSTTYTENKSAAAEEEVGVEDLSPAVEEKGVREAADREVDQQSTGVAVLGGDEGVLLGSPRSAGEQELGGSSDEECSSSLPSPSKCQRTQGPTEVTGK